MQEGVVNRSQTDRACRLHAGFSVAYANKDLRAVMALAEGAPLAVGGARLKQA
jgi:hypothetical protein